MIHSTEDVREIARREGFSPGAIARACDPPLSPVTVWRVMAGRHAGNAPAVQALSEALDRLIKRKGGQEPCAEQA